MELSSGAAIDPKSIEYNDRILFALKGKEPQPTG
jgi:hypothetical protein